MCYNDNVYLDGSRMYRSRAEIKEDIKYISERISEVNESLNIRELISNVFNEDGGYDIVKRAESVTEILKYAEEALVELRSLNERLDELKAELLSSAEICSSYERGEI